MNKRTLGKLGLLMLIGAILGFVGSMLMMKLHDIGNGFIRDFGEVVVNYSIIWYIMIALVVFLPAFYYYQRSKKAYERIEEVDEDALDTLELYAEKHMDIALTINGVFLFFNFLLIGTTFRPEADLVAVTMVLFMINTLLASSLEIIAVRTIQKNNPRLKGDPTSLSFQKTYLNSCDEAEQLRIFKAGYHAFNTSRQGTMALVIVTILFNMLFETGSFAVIISCTLLLIQTLSYGYQAIKHNGGSI